MLMQKFLFPVSHNVTLPTTVAELSKERIVFYLLNAVAVVSNPTTGMDICVSLFCVYCPVRR
jgi:hypothetical protein